MTAEIRRGTDRFVDRVPGRVSRHAFSFGEHYDAERVSFGPMVCHDDHLLGSGRGFETHHHADLEIVTWVVSGALTHTDSSGHSAGGSTEVTAGQVAVLSAGSGVDHSEVAAAAGPARFVQVWLRPDETGTATTYEVAEQALEPGRLVPVVSSASAPSAGSAAPLRVGVAGAELSVVRLDAGGEITLPAGARRTHLFVTTGALTRSSLAQPLAAGDAFLLTDEVSHTVTAAVPTELLVWTFAGAG